jgi:hypothetical protein
MLLLYFKVHRVEIFPQVRQTSTGTGARPYLANAGGTLQHPPSSHLNRQPW